MITRTLNKTFENRFSLLLVSLGLFLILPPFLNNKPLLEWLIPVLGSFTIVICTLIILKETGEKTAIVVLTLVLLLTWLSYISRSYPSIQLAKDFVYLIFFGITAFRVLMQVFNIEKVDEKVIFGSIGGYLLLGLVGSLLCNITETISPNSFVVSDAIGIGFYNYIYFSFVTLTTLGYGDITPITHQGKAISVAIAIIGQLYIAIVIAMLIAKYIQSRNK